MSVCVYRMLDEGLLTLAFSASFNSTFQIKDKFLNQYNEGNNTVMKMECITKYVVLQYQQKP